MTTIPKFKELNPKLQGFITGVSLTLLTVLALGVYLTTFYNA